VSSSSAIDYTGVTETPGTLVSRHAASMAMSRYELVRRLATRRRVLEIACGSGQGLGYVGRNAACIIGGDITASLLNRAQQHYGRRVRLVRLDAHALPFGADSFDLVQIHEAIYYMAKPARVFAECRRVLSRDGVLVVSSVNPSRTDFHRSPYATRYLDAGELKAVLECLFRRVDILFGFPAPQRDRAAAARSALKWTAGRLGLIPRTMRGKTFLKRVFFGPLVAMPPELASGLAPVDTPRLVPIHASPSFRVIYAIALR
jgi:SAM-dependent methyltransferase